MTREEMAQLSDYAARLWPAFEPTPEQAEIWYDALRRFDYHSARQALGIAYSTTKWKTPSIPDVRDAIRKLTRARMGENDADFPPEFVAQVEQEESEERLLLTNWTPSDFEDGKSEIMLREPGMDRFEKLPATGKFWTHFLVERYVHHRAITFPTKVRIEKHKGHPDIIHQPLPTQRVRDEWWDQCAPLMAQLAHAKTQPRNIRNATIQQLGADLAVPK